MGVLNVTPDSFFDGGRYVEAEASRQRVDRLLSEGASIIDIGAESSRPGASPIPAAAQMDRLDAALKYAVSRGAMVSIDTTSPEVADHALRLGARFLNDVSCLADAELAGGGSSSRGDARAHACAGSDRSHEGLLGLPGRRLRRRRRRRARGVARGP